MPILPAEPAVFPDDLLENENSRELAGRRWHVMHTRPRQEKSLARELRCAGVPYYLPQIPCRRRLRGRAITSHIPLFPGYLPVFADQEERIRTLATRRVVRPLEVPDQPEFWKDLTQIHQLIVSGAPLRPEDRFVPGVRVVVRNGLLAGFEGVIYRSASGRRFVVQVNFLQRGASVLLDEVDIALAN
jgi:transcriptional antiterminator RfaH